MVRLRKAIPFGSNIRETIRDVRIVRKKRKQRSGRHAEAG